MVSEYTLDLRIAAIFVIFVSAMLLGLPPILMKRFQDTENKLACLLRSFSAGVILGLATIHIIPSAYFELAGLVEYNFGGVVVLGGVLLLVIIESSLQSFYLHRPAGSNPCGHGPHGGDSARAIEAHDVDAEKAAASTEASLAAHVRQPSGTHGHECLRSVTTDTFVAFASGPLQRVRHYVTAYTMELGCIFHSVIIGVSIGVMTDSRMGVVVMLIAIAFHQALEGLSLGSVLSRANFSRLKQLVMLAMYAITTPLGIAIGIGVAHTYDPDSVTSRAVQGSLNGVSGGMLLYISIYQLIAEEFSKTQLLTQTRFRLGMYAALILGAGCMAVLALWA
jgi:zinc transporter 1/2/3